MSKLFGNMSKEGTEAVEDRLGGGGRDVFETDAYPATIKLAYAGKAESGAQSMNFEFELENGKTYKETLWVSNKSGENFFLNKNDKTKKVLLPGYVTADDIALLTAEIELNDLEFEEKVINLYDFDAKKEVPTKVQMAVELLGKKVILGLQKITQFKQKKEGDVYVDTAEVDNKNEIKATFHHELMVTVREAQDGQKEPGFYPAWVERNQGKTYDKTKGKAPASGTPGANGSAPAGGASSAPRKSLFG